MRSRSWRGRGWVVIVGLALACASLPSPEPEPTDEAPPLAPPARLELTLLQGFRERPEPPPPRAERVEILIDVTTSMLADTPGGPTREAAARAAAASLVRSLPASTPLRVHALGTEPGDRCTGPHPLSAGADHEDLATRIGGLEAMSEGSLAGALEALAASASDLELTRFTVYTDLAGECGGDLCQALESVAAQGARIDLVLLGGAAAPACAADLGPRGAPQVAQDRVGAPPVSFRVARHHVRDNGIGSLLARGTANAPAIEVPSGAVIITLELDPPSAIGPLLLSPGTLTRVRVVDFPGVDPHVREWRWDVTEDRPAEEAAPPAEPAPEDATGEPS